MISTTDSFDAKEHTMKLELTKYLQEKIKSIEDNLKVECEEREIDYNSSSHYDLSIEDGEPYSSGNSTDCYDDGYNRGEQDGELATLKDILKYIN